MRITKILVVSLSMLAIAAFSNAQDKGGKKQGGGGPPPMLTVKVDAFADGARVPEKFTCAAGQGSPSPAISWSGGPGGAASYAIIMHDPDPVIGNSINDVLHWAIFDIPAGSKGLPEGVKPGDQANGAKQINNIAGQPGYLGPCPPPGHGDHHYTIEVYALNAKLGLPGSTSRADLLKAMDGKIVSKGVYIGIFGRK
ncbi:MAG: YbhB/YbcL family Raf kinase inhibitor-like protein [Bryobacteraceae bacterium]